jgi:hypothetical protein
VLENINKCEDVCENVNENLNLMNFSLNAQDEANFCTKSFLDAVDKINGHKDCK